MGQDKSRVLTENIVETQKDMNDDVLMSSHVLAIAIWHQAIWTAAGFIFAGSINSNPKDHSLVTTSVPPQ